VCNNSGWGGLGPNLGKNINMKIIIQEITKKAPIFDYLVISREIELFEGPYVPYLGRKLQK